MNTMLEQHKIHNTSAANHPVGDKPEDQEAELLIPPLTVELTRDDYNMVQSFKPFIEGSTPQ